MKLEDTGSVFISFLVSLDLLGVSGLQCYSCENWHWKQIQRVRACEDPFEPDGHENVEVRRTCSPDETYCEKYVRKIDPEDDQDYQNRKLITAGSEDGPRVTPPVHRIMRKCTTQCIEFGRWWEDRVHRCCQTDFCNHGNGTLWKARNSQWMISTLMMMFYAGCSVL